MLNFIISAAIVVVIIIFALKLFQRITVNINRPQIKEIDPTTTGERLKKYLVKAGKLNPKTVKVALLSRTTWSEGGKIASVAGCLPTKNCTRFILRPRFVFGKKYLFYCPTDLHSSLHNKEVLIYGVGIENAGGYYYPLPNGSKMSNYETFRIVAKQFESDLRKMLTMDSLQMELEQTYRGIAGMGREKEFYDERENVVEYERVKDTGDYNESY